MFWDNFYALCSLHNKKPNPVAKELGYSSATVTKWKNGTSPNLSAAADIANYFHVTIDELLNGRFSKCYRCGYEYNPNNATYCKKCGKILNDNFCTNPDCDADGRNNSGGATLLSSDCEYCPYCGSESTYKTEGLFENKSIKFKEHISKNDMLWISLLHKLSYEKQCEVKGYINRILDEAVAADESLEETGTYSPK